MCAPQRTHRRGDKRRSQGGERSQPRDNLTAASLAVTAIQQLLPTEITVQVVGFLAGSSPWTIDDAIEYGNFKLIRYIHAAQRYTPVPVCTPLAIDRAAGTGNLALLQWLHQNRSEGCSQMAFYNAARRNHLHVLQWLFDHKDLSNDISGIDNGVIYHAVQAGSNEVLDWLCSTRPGFVPLYSVFDHACRCGHLSVVQLLQEKGRSNPSLAKATTNAMDAAADQGHLDVVQWLHKHRTEGCTTNAMDYAAARGHLGVLQWLHTNRTEGCTRRALFNAVTGGHIKVVEWILNEHIVPLSQSLLSEAMEFAAYHDQKTLWSLLASRNESCRMPVQERPLGDLFILTQTRLAT